MDEKITIAVAGLGNRGLDAYIPALLRTGKVKIVALAEPRADRLQAAAQLCGVNKDSCFATAEELFVRPRLAKAAVIATQDRQHVPQVLLALNQGYHLLLEKPISPVLEECREVLRVADEKKRLVVVCHVLRYTPFFLKVKKLLDSGIIGEIASIQAIENVGYWHQAHSFVRGNWRMAQTHSPMILQKCCHDFDLYMWLASKRCNSVSSYGGTYHFKADKAPHGAAKRCLDGCTAKESCPYDAEKIYVTNPKTGIAHGNTGWPCEVLQLNPTEKGIRNAIENGPYGRCVYYCDNNVVDHQVVSLEMQDGSTMAFTMCGFTEQNSRHAKFMGTAGELVADLGARKIEIFPFGSTPIIYNQNDFGSDIAGHAGGDDGIADTFIKALGGGQNVESMSTLSASMESHYIALAAEKSRLNGGAAIQMDTMRKA